MKNIFLFFFLAATRFVFGQSDYDSTKTYKPGDVVASISDGSSCGCPVGFHPGQKVVEKKWITFCIKDGPKKQKPTHVKSETTPKSGNVKIQDSYADIIKKHGEILNDNSDQLKDHEGRLKKLETPKVDDQEEKQPSNSNEEIEEKKEPENFAVSFPAKEETKKDSFTDQYYWFVVPFLGIFAETNKNKDITSKFIFGGQIALEGKITFRNKITLFLAPSFVFVPSKNRYQLTEPSPFPKEKVNDKGFLLSGGIGYEINKFVEIFGKYGWSPTQTLPKQGVSLGLEMSLADFPVHLEVETSYEQKNINFGLSIFYRYIPKPKA